ncbi:MAG: PepSY-like domain-containing protein [Bacteroidia bacterium]
MKNVFTFLLSLFFLLQLVSAQPITDHGVSRGMMEVPAPILNAFEESFSGAEKVSWSRLNGDYLAEFTKGGHSMRAIFAANGVWKYTDIDVREQFLNDRIRQHIMNYYPDAVIKKTTLHDEPGKSSYSIEILTGGRPKVLRYSDKYLPMD